MVNRPSLQNTFEHNTAFSIGNPGQMFLALAGGRVNPSPRPNENAGATITGTHWCDDEVNLPVSIPTTDVYH